MFLAIGQRKGKLRKRAEVRPGQQIQDLSYVMSVAMEMEVGVMITHIGIERVVRIVWGVGDRRYASLH